MTAPMAFDNPNIIVGGDMREFLALGCRTAYFALDDLTNRRRRLQMVAGVEAGSPREDAEEALLLGCIEEAFDLRPWHDAEQRLDELAAAYLPRLQTRRGA